MRYGVTARRKRNMRRVGQLADLRSERREARRSQGVATMIAQDTKSSGALVVEVENVSKAWGDNVIVDNLSLRIMRKDRLGLVGPNGAGKTTLINLLTGELEPDSGLVRLGAQLSTATLDQRRATLAPTTTLVDALTGGGSDFVEINGERKHVIGYMKDFLFQPDQARTPIGKLSGGERGRLMLARALSVPSNFLVLDEPTNDLDIETLDLLQELLADYPGTILLVSHDRDFLDRVVTSVLVSEGNGRWQEYAGGYTDMVNQRGYGLGGPETAPVVAPVKEKQAKRVAPGVPAGTKRKLSFNEKRGLETLPKRIEELNADLAKLDAILADSTLHEKNPQYFQKATATYAHKRAEIEKAEEEWLALEMLREEIEGPAR